MSNYTTAIRNSAEVDLRKIKQANLKRQLEEVIQTSKEDPYVPMQSFEKLRSVYGDRYSRRLNRQHRMVCKVDGGDKVIEIYSAWTHHERGKKNQPF